MSDSASTGIGASVVRREDQRFLTGQGRYADDVNLPGMARAYVVRSPHAHARMPELMSLPPAPPPAYSAYSPART